MKFFINSMFHTAILLLVLPAIGISSAYHVSQNGSGKLDGKLPADSWSIQHFNDPSNWSPISEPDKISPGDTVFFHGSINTAPIVAGSGNANGRINLDFQDSTLSITTQDSPISINGKSYITIRNASWDNNFLGGYLISFNQKSSSFVSILNNQFDGPDEGSNAKAIDLRNCSYCEIDGNSFVDVRTGVGGDSVMIHDVTISNNVMITTAGTATYESDVIRIGDAYNINITGNKLVQRQKAQGGVAHDDIIQTYKKGGSNAGYPKDWVIEYNWLELNTTSTNDKSWTMLEKVSGSWTFRGNIFVGTDGGEQGNGLMIWGHQPGSRTYLYNNIFVSKSGPGYMIRLGLGASSDVHHYLDNNIIYNLGGNAVTVEGGTLHHNNNITFGPGNYEGLTDDLWANATDLPSTDPLFTDYENGIYTLESNSSALNAGLDLGAEFRHKIVPESTWPNPTILYSDQIDIGPFDITAILPEDNISPNPPSFLTIN